MSFCGGASVECRGHQQTVAPTQHFIKLNIVNKIESVHWTVKKPLVLSAFTVLCPTFYAPFYDSEVSQC